jgi:hypothetical protein
MTKFWRIEFSAPDEETVNDIIDSIESRHYSNESGDDRRCLVVHRSILFQQGHNHGDPKVERMRMGIKPDNIENEIYKLHLENAMRESKHIKSEL